MIKSRMKIRTPQSLTGSEIEKLWAENEKGAYVSITEEDKDELPKFDNWWYVGNAMFIDFKKVNNDFTSDLFIVFFEWLEKNYPNGVLIKECNKTQTENV